MATVAIIQARMGSTRLPGKVLMPLRGRPMLWHVAARARAAKHIDDVLVATTLAPEDDAIRSFCEDNRVNVFSGNENDVLDRYRGAAQMSGADPVVRITSDCPLVDPGVIDKLLEKYGGGAFDYVGVSIGGAARAFGRNGYPDGLDAECLSRAALDRAWREAANPADREHVTSYIWRNQDLFRCGTLVPETDWSDLRLTVDEPADLTLVGSIYDALYKEGRMPFGFDEVIGFLRAHQDLARLNSSLVGKEKYRGLWEDVARRSGPWKETS